VRAVQDFHVPLIIAAAVFGVFMLWKVRPAAFSPARAAARAALREAQKRIEHARDEQSRAAALADAGDAAAGAAVSASSAIGFYLRAMRLVPTSADLVDRAAAGLTRRPRALETLLWRRLGAEPWTGAARPAARAAIRHLVALYNGPIRNAIRARAMEQALGALGE
jgi:hypothetical protein